MSESNPKVVGILQARNGSSRLPGKVLAEVLGAPMLAHIVDRSRQARRLDELVVATTTLDRDDPVAAVAAERGAAVFRGSEHDVLDRYYHAAEKHKADVVVRLTADDPFVDGPFIDWAVERFLESPGCRYLDTTTSGTFPHGLAVQIFTFDALAESWREADEADSCEHVVPYMNQRPQRFGNRYLECERDLSHLRWTVDFPEDLELVRRVFKHFGHGRFTWREALEAVESNAELMRSTRAVRT